MGGYQKFIASITLVMAAKDAGKNADLFGGSRTRIRGRSYDDRLILLQDATGISSLAAFLKSIPCAAIPLTQFENPAYV